jgi:serine/threonine protein kinase
MTLSPRQELSKLDSTKYVEETLKDDEGLSTIDLKERLPRTPLVTVNERDIININLAHYEIQNEVFEIPPRYLIEDVIGKGAYGMVVSCKDTKTNQRVAIKKCGKVFPTGAAERILEESRDIPQSKMQLLRQTLIPKRILREMKIMCHLNHPNIVNMKALIPPRSYATFKDVYFVQDLMEADLRDFLVTGQKLSDKHVQYLMYQMLSAMSHVHSSNILHRDLKPENILINSNCQVKICDFGLARGMDWEEDPTMSTNYVQTRWYRAPELLLNYKSVSPAIDIWSLGCIMAELMGVGVLFKGSSPINQLEKILQVMGTQEAGNIKGSPQSLEFINKLPVFKAKPLESLFPDWENPEAVEFLKELLQFNPEKRITAIDALRHPYLRDMVEEGHERYHLAESKFDYSFETSINDLLSIKREAFDTILDFAGIERRIATPTSTRYMTEDERESRLREKEMCMMSPTANMVRVQFNEHIEQELQKERENETSSADAKKKVGLFNRMRAFIKNL